MIKKYLDANVFLNPVLYDDSKAKKCEGILSSLIHNGFSGYTSSLTWDEVIYVISKNLGKSFSLEESERFLKFPNLNFISTDKKVIDKAHLLIKKYSLKPRDAIHLASAILYGCTEIISDDSDFDSIREIKRVGF